MEMLFIQLINMKLNFTRKGKWFLDNKKAPEGALVAEMARR
jgi:hypothetical protein